MNLTKFINKKPYLIAGPCSAESEEQVLKTANLLVGQVDIFRAGIWKPRTSPNSFEGVGEEGLRWLQTVKKQTSLKVITEVATARHVELCLKYNIDALWIGSRTTVNPFYVHEIAESLKGVNIPVFIKNPIHPELSLWLGAFERLNKVGVTKLAAIHRGFYSNDKSTFRNDPKWEILIKLKEELHNLPIICDPSHIAGRVSIIEDISQTAMDFNLDGLMIETHNNPKIALSDAKQQIKPAQLKKMMRNLIVRDASLRNDIFREQLLSFRNQIDVLDHNIIKILENRKEIVKEIAMLKDKNSLTIFQLERWFEILSTRKESAKSLDLDDHMVTEIFEVIHKYSILTQTKLMRK